MTYKKSRGVFYIGFWKKHRRSRYKQQWRSENRLIKTKDRRYHIGISSRKDRYLILVGSNSRHRDNKLYFSWD